MWSRIPVCLIALACLGGTGGASRGASILGGDTPPSDAYLGIRVRPLASAPSTNIEFGALLVATVDPTGPAAGKLQPRDVLRELNGQLLFNVAQLQALLATLHVGDSVDARILRGPSNLVMAFPLQALDAGMDTPLLDDECAGVGNDSAERDLIAHPDQVETLLRQIRGAYEDSLPADVLDAGQTEQFLEEVRRHIEGALQPPPTHPDAYRVRPPVPVAPPSDDTAASTMSGNDASLTLSIRNGQRVYSYRDANGNILYEGTLDDAEDRKKVPLEAWKMLYQMEKTAPKPR